MCACVRVGIYVVDAIAPALTGKELIRETAFVQRAHSRPFLKVSNY